MFKTENLHRNLVRFTAVAFIHAFMLSNTAFAVQPSSSDLLSPESRFKPAARIVNGIRTEIGFNMRDRGFSPWNANIRMMEFGDVMRHDPVVQRVLIPWEIRESEFDPQDLAIWRAYQGGKKIQDFSDEEQEIIEVIEEELAGLESFVMNELTNNSFDSFIDKISALGIDGRDFTGRLTIEAFYDGDDAVVRVIDNGKPIEMKDDGNPVTRERGREHFGGGRMGTASIREGVQAKGGSIRWYPLRDGTMTVVRLPRDKMSSRFRIKREERIIVEDEEGLNAEDDLKRDAISAYITILVDDARRAGVSSRGLERLVDEYLKTAGSSTDVLITVGGNSFVQPGERGDQETQLENLRKTFTREAVDLIRNGGPVTHGNGPQAGIILEELEAEIGAFSEMPDEEVRRNLAEKNVVWQTQAEIGGLIKRVLTERGVPEAKIEVIITHVAVNPSDTEFLVPTKPIGKRAKDGPDDRKRVPSPKPLKIVEIEKIINALREGKIVICVGGGGIPVDNNVYETNGDLKVLGAVIDKDYATALLAKELRERGVDIPRLIISTGEPYMYEHYGTEDAVPMRRVTPGEIRNMIHEDADGRKYPAGKVRPKMTAAAEFIEDGGREVRITSPEKVPFPGEGTVVVPDGTEVERAAIALRSLRHGRSKVFDLGSRLRTVISFLDLLDSTYHVHFTGQYGISEMIEESRAIANEMLRIDGEGSKAVRERRLTIGSAREYITAMRRAADRLNPILEKAIRMREKSHSDPVLSVDTHGGIYNFLSFVVNSAGRAIKELESRVQLMNAEHPSGTISMGEVLGELRPGHFYSGVVEPLIADNRVLSLRVRCNGLSVVSALSNVIDNAVFFAKEKNNGNARVMLSAADTGDGFVEIRVRDNGGGVGEKFLEHDKNTGKKKLFMLNASGRRGGTGLGLAEAWYAIRDIGGTIDVVSESRAGAEFIVRLPVAGASIVTPATERLSAEDLTDDVKLLQRDLDRKVSFVALGTGWISGYGPRGAQYGDMNPLVISLRKFFERQGIKFIEGDDEEVETAVRDILNGDPEARGMVLAGEGTVGRLETLGENVFLAGVDGAALTDESYVRLVEMFRVMALLMRLNFRDEISVGAVAARHPHLGISFVNKNRIAFLPDAEPLGEIRRELYRVQIFA